MRDRDARQRRRLAGGQAGVGRIGLGQRLVPGHGDKSVEIVIQARDTAQEVLRELSGRHLAVLERLGQLRNGCFVHACGVGHPGPVSLGGSGLVDGYSMTLGTR